MLLIGKSGVNSSLRARSNSPAAVPSGGALSLRKRAVVALSEIGREAHNRKAAGDRA